MPPLPEVAALEGQGEPARAVPGARALRQPVGKRTPGPSPKAMDDRAFEAAVDKWHLILVKAGMSSGIGRQCSEDTKLLRQSIAQCLELKAAGTAHKRAGAFILYMDWAQKAHAVPFPLQEEVCNQYLLTAVNASATRASSFLEATLFAKGLFDLDNADEMLTSRNKGLAARGTKRKRARVQRTPYSCSALETIETIVSTGIEHCCLSDQEYILLGFALFRIHARLRCGDATRITKEPVVDDMFFESELTSAQHKTGHAKAFKDLRLPVTGYACGVFGGAWCAEWIAARKQLQLNAEADGTLMPSLLADGSFGAGRMSTSEIGVWEKSILTKLGLCSTADASTLGTHSRRRLC